MTLNSGLLTPTCATFWLSHSALSQNASVLRAGEAIVEISC